MLVAISIVVVDITTGSVLVATIGVVVAIGKVEAAARMDSVVVAV